MNSFRIKFFIISILFSVNVFASSVRAIFQGLRRWNAERSMHYTSPSLFQLTKISKAGKREALDIIASGKKNELYSSLYSHLERNPGLVKSFDIGGDIKETTEALVVSLVGMKRHENNLMERVWREADDRDIFLDLWDVEPARAIIAGYIRKDHLIDNPKLLLKYWAERGRMYFTGPDHFLVLKDRLVYFIHSSLEEVYGSIDDMLSLNDNFARFLESPFGETIVSASRESEDFATEFQATMELIDRGVRSTSLGERLPFENLLYRGRTFEELIQEGRGPKPLSPDRELMWRTQPSIGPMGGGGSGSDDSVYGL